MLEAGSNSLAGGRGVGGEEVGGLERLNTERSADKALLPCTRRAGGYSSSQFKSSQNRVEMEAPQVQMGAGLCKRSSGTSLRSWVLTNHSPRVGISLCVKMDTAPIPQGCCEDFRR